MTASMGRKLFIVTGGAGFIGARLVAALKSLPEAEVIVLDNVVRPTGSSNVRQLRCDVREKIDVPVTTEDYSRASIFHLAALCKEPAYDWREYFETNYYGTKNICDFALRNGIKEIVFTSTMMVFAAGERENTEEDIATPDTAYGLSKLLAEEVLLGWKNLDSQNRLKIVRPGVVFGKGENGNYTRLYNALKRNLFVYVGRKDTIKGSVYLKDVVDFLVFLLNDESERSIYNFVFPRAVTVREISQAICEVMGFKRFTPVLPYKLLLTISYFFEMLNSIGLKNPVHHRRIEKLYRSTHLSANAAVEAGYKFSYDLRGGLEDWKRECGGKGLF